MIESLLSIMIVLILFYIFTDFKKSERKKAEKEAREEDRIAEQSREKRGIEMEEKKKSYYIKQLPRIYDKFSSKELIYIYNLLQRMYQNEVRDFFDDPNAEVKTEIYNSAARELRKITGNSQWKHYYYNKEFCEFYSNSWDDPVAKWDMYYVYNLLCSRGIKNW